MRIHRFKTAFAAVALVIAPAAHTQPVNDHGLAPGEKLVTLGDNCHVVRDFTGAGNMSSEDVAKYLAMFKGYIWKGDCHLGVANGAAYFGPSTPIGPGIILPGATVLERTEYTTTRRRHTLPGHDEHRGLRGPVEPGRRRYHRPRPARRC
jgi:hypothetical protein